MIVEPAMSAETHPARNCHRRVSRTLGEIKVDAFEQDVVINDRSQAFSAELLRLALLGVGGVGYVASRALTNAPAESVRMNSAAKWLVLIAAASFGLCAASALSLRYFSSELIAFQLRIVRLRVRGTVDDGSEAETEEGRRNRRLKVMRPTLLISSGALGIGAGVFIVFLFVVLRP
jgi:hypothetical protein